MAFAIVMLVLFGFLGWLTMSAESETPILQRNADDNILRTLRTRYVNGDLDRDEYERILRVLG